MIEISVDLKCRVEHHVECDEWHAHFTIVLSGILLLCTVV